VRHMKEGQRKGERVWQLGYEGGREVGRGEREIDGEREREVNIERGRVESGGREGGGRERERERERERREWQGDTK
jgi:hypothetical protein